MGRDAQVPVALRGHDPLACQRGDERPRVGRADADQRASALRLARRDDARLQLVETVDQA